MFVGRAFGLLPSVISFSLLFWAFQIGSSGPGLSVSGAPITLSVALVLLLVALFMISVVGPYVVGLERAKKHRIELLEAERAWVLRVLEVFEDPNPDGAGADVERLAGEVDADVNRIAEHEVLPPSEDESSQIDMRARWAAGVLAQHNLVLKHFAWLGNLRASLERASRRSALRTRPLPRDACETAGRSSTGAAEKISCTTSTRSSVRGRR
jgi:hypothetical protein